MPTLSQKNNTFFAVRPEEALEVPSRKADGKSRPHLAPFRAPRQRPERAVVDKLSTNGVFRIDRELG